MQQLHVRPAEGAGGTSVRWGRDDVAPAGALAGAFAAVRPAPVVVGVEAASGAGARPTAAALVDPPEPAPRPDGEGSVCRSSDAGLTHGSAVTTTP